MGKAVREAVTRMGATDSVAKLEERVTELEKRMAEKDTEFAVINTKLTAILWGVGTIATAVIGVLVQMVF